jgi:RNA polymerase sigma-70 factor (ECF subfamily)
MTIEWSALFDLEMRSDEVEERAITLWHSARAAWPALDLDARVFGEHLARHRAAGESVTEWLNRVHAGDLYLACACAHQVRGAVEAFDAAFVSKVPGFLRRTRLSGSVDDVVQAVRERLFVPRPGLPARIADYSGRGALESWLRVLTLRTAINMGQRRQETPNDSEPFAPSQDPELDFIKDRYRGAFKDALLAALRQLPAEQQTLLRLHFVEGATLDELARLYQLHRATIARRLATAREAVVDDVRARVNQALKLAPDEFDSFMRLVRSQIDITITGLLKSSYTNG